MDNTTYNEILIMLYLSVLIYKYNNGKFIFENNKTLKENIYLLNNKYINGLNDVDFDDIEIKGLLYLSNMFPDGKIISFIDIDEIQVGIIVNDVLKNIIIIFRGTDSFSDILYDCSITKKQLENDIFVHGGFYDQLNTIYGNLLDLIKNYIILEYDIYISGHSAGGAYSLILSHLLSKMVNKPIKVITFGCPRIGNYQWKLLYNLNNNIINYRVSNKKDIITALPIYDYYHVGINIHLVDDDVEININNDYIYYNYYCGLIFRSYNIFDHLLKNYHNNLINKKEIFNEKIKLL